MSLDEFTFQLLHAGTYDEAFELLNKHVEKAGFEGTLYTYIPKIMIDQDFPKEPIFSISDRYAPTFIEHYMEAGYVQKDGILRSMLQGYKKPLDWWEGSANELYDSDGQEVIDVARYDYNLQNGITIPTASNEKGSAMVSIISSEKADAYQTLKSESLAELTHIAEIFHMIVMHKGYEFDTFIRPLLENFSELETNAIRHIPTSSTIKELADKIGSTPRYTDKVLRNIRIKFAGEDIAGRPKINISILRYYIMLMDLHQKL